MSDQSGRTPSGEALDVDGYYADAVKREEERQKQAAEGRSLSSTEEAAMSGDDHDPACPYCGHALAHHDQPDCWECTNAGTYCDSEMRDA